LERYSFGKIKNKKKMNQNKNVCGAEEKNAKRYNREKKKKENDPFFFSLNQNESLFKMWSK